MPACVVVVGLADCNAGVLIIILAKREQICFVALIAVSDVVIQRVHLPYK